jgi:hypothetical protein
VTRIPRHAYGGAGHLGTRPRTRAMRAVLGLRPSSSMQRPRMPPGAYAPLPCARAGLFSPIVFNYEPRANLCTRLFWCAFLSLPVRAGLASPFFWGHFRHPLFFGSTPANSTHARASHVARAGRGRHAGA